MTVYNLTKRHMGAGRNANTGMSSEGETETDSSKQEMEQPQQIEELIPKQVATSVRNEAYV